MRTVLIVTTRQKGAGRCGAAPETTSIRASRPTTRTLRGSLRPALGSRRSSGGDTDLPLDSSDDDIDGDARPRRGGQALYVVTVQVAAVYMRQGAAQPSQYEGRVLPTIAAASGNAPRTSRVPDPQPPRQQHNPHLPTTPSDPAWG